METATLTRAEERKALRLMNAVKARSALSNLVVEKSAVAWLSRNPVVGERGREVLSGYVSSLDSQIDTMVKVLDFGIRGYAKRMLVPPREYEAHKEEVMEAQEKAAEELKRISLEPELDAWSRSNLAGRVNKHEAAKKAVLIKMTVWKGIPVEVRGTIAQAMADVEANDRAILARLRRPDESEEARTVMGILRRASVTTEVDDLALVANYAAFSRDFRNKGVDRMSALVGDANGNEEVRLGGAELLRRAMAPKTPPLERELLVTSAVRIAEDRMEAERGRARSVSIPVIVARPGPAEERPFQDN